MSLAHKLSLFSPFQERQPALTIRAETADHASLFKGTARSATVHTSSRVDIAKVSPDSKND